MKGRKFEFPVKDWMDAKEGVFAQAEYALSSNGFHDETIKPPAKPNPFGLSEYHSFVLFLNSCEVSCNTIFLQLKRNLLEFVAEVVTLFFSFCR